MSIDLFNRHIEIELKKKRLVLLAERHGRTSPLVLAFSRHLDELIVEYIKLRRRLAA